MGLFYRLQVSAVLLFIVIHLADGYRTFQGFIPNGDRIPHPCIADTMWPGVGHKAAGGGGARNPFGLAFYNNGKVWNRTLCEMDSDGDGQTNGQELGDPGCTWTVGNTPSRTTDLSHPGICEPHDSAACMAINTGLDCTAFSCPAINEVETITHPVRIPRTRVPPRVTTYQCMPFEFPMDQTYHMVATKPNIDNRDVMHHIVIYGCTDEVTFTDEELSSSYNCFMGNRKGCNEFIGIWALGFDGYCFHEQAGLKVGVGGIKRAILELHWDNPMKNADYYDASGMDFFLTPKLRRYDAGVVMIGEDRMHIPPKEEKYTVHGTCAAECTRNAMAGDVQVFSVTNHMHYLGRSALSKIVTPENRVTYLGLDTTFSYDRPVMHSFQQPITVRPGDQLELTCDFNSMTRNRTTRQGDATNDEMCYAFLFYYPAENLQAATCTSHGPYSACHDFSQGHIVKGCNFDQYMDVSIPAIAKRFEDIDRLCSENMCFKECKEYVKELYSTDPCYSDELRGYATRYALGSDTFMLEIRDYILKIKSCDMEIGRESVTCPTIPPPGETSGAQRVTTATMMVSAFVVIMQLL